MPSDMTSVTFKKYSLWDEVAQSCNNKNNNDDDDDDDDDDDSMARGSVFIYLENLPAGECITFTLLICEHC